MKSTILSLLGGVGIALLVLGVGMAAVDPDAEVLPRPSPAREVQKAAPPAPAISDEQLRAVAKLPTRERMMLVDRVMQAAAVAKLSRQERMALVQRVMQAVEVRVRVVGVVYTPEGRSLPQWTLEDAAQNAE